MMNYLYIGQLMNDPSPCLAVSPQWVILTPLPASPKRIIYASFKFSCFSIQSQTFIGNHSRASAGMKFWWLAIEAKFGRVSNNVCILNNVCQSYMTAWSVWETKTNYSSPGFWFILGVYKIVLLPTSLFNPNSKYRNISKCCLLTTKKKKKQLRVN